MRNLIQAKREVGIFFESCKGDKSWWPGVIRVAVPGSGHNHILQSPSSDIYLHNAGPFFLQFNNKYFRLSCA